MNMYRTMLGHRDTYPRIRRPSPLVLPAGEEESVLFTSENGTGHGHVFRNILKVRFYSEKFEFQKHDVQQCTHTSVPMSKLQFYFERHNSNWTSRKKSQLHP